MCPKRIRPMAPKQQYVSPVKKSSNNIINDNTLTRRTNQVLKDSKGVLDNVETEPGFILENDEIEKLKLWKKGIIPYYIDNISYSDKILRDQIRQFLNTVNSLTMLRFVELPSPPADEETRYVFFVNRRAQLGCFDQTALEFTNRGVQQVHLGYDCFDGELARAVLAIAGVPPQHNAPNRDNFIEIIFENIMPENRKLFEKMANDEWLFGCDSYDYQSATHYNNHQYSVNGKATIEIARERGLQDGHLGENNKFTISDIMKLRMLYNYIVTKDDEQLPLCKKLFRKGLHFDSSVSEEEEDVIVPPREPPRCHMFNKPK
ncbi:hypothetical protein PYW08_001216 [Mythimna loreyi]|uniref:Uncharacterized protein n=1 Tax=Mythimna loreyi TaxID=667449 RepID=A0ACC2QZR5_9NEOP|nr:hypothetical protein PYW08_001216 [Mythimna loreyi]